MASGVTTSGRGSSLARSAAPPPLAPRLATRRGAAASTKSGRALAMSPGSASVSAMTCRSVARDPRSPARWRQGRRPETPRSGRKGGRRDPRGSAASSCRARERKQADNFRHPVGELQVEDQGFQRLERLGVGQISGPDQEQPRPRAQGKSGPETPCRRGSRRCCPTALPTSASTCRSRAPIRRQTRQDHRDQPHDPTPVLIAPPAACCPSCLPRLLFLSHRHHAMQLVCPVH